MAFQLIHTLVLASLITLVAIAYGIRVALKGPAHFERIDRDGGSALLGKRLMEGAYWSLQPVAKLLIFCRVTPNMISWTSFALALAAGASLAFGHFGSGAIFATISALFDALDGMVARLTHTDSAAGIVLDSSLDRYSEWAFLAGLALHYSGVPVLLGLTLLALHGSYMVSYSTAKAEAMQIEPPRGSMRRGERAFYLILGAGLSPVTIPWFEMERAYGIAVGHPMVIALGMVAVISNVSAVERLYAIAKTAKARQDDQRRKLAEQGAESDEAAVRHKPCPR